jgi:hypothetical protein
MRGEAIRIGSTSSVCEGLSRRETARPLGSTRERCQDAGVLGAAGVIQVAGKIKNGQDPWPGPVYCAMKPPSTGIGRPVT